MSLSLKRDNTVQSFAKEINCYSIPDTYLKPYVSHLPILCRLNSPQVTAITRIILRFLKSDSIYRNSSTFQLCVVSIIGTKISTLHTFKLQFREKEEDASCKNLGQSSCCSYNRLIFKNTQGTRHQDNDHGTPPPRQNGEGLKLLKHMHIHMRELVLPGV